MRLHAFISTLALCMGLTACGPDVFYIPIDNKLGNAKPLSKTEDTVRVIVPERITKSVAKARTNNSDWLKGSKLAFYIGLAKIKTDDVLREQGYKVVGADVNGSAAVHDAAEGHPNVIAMVDSSVLKTYDKTYTWQEPIATDPTIGQPTMWDTKGQTVTMHLIEYKIKIVRPIGKDNPLFTCNNSSLTAKLCVYSQDNPSTYETIFEGYGTMDTNARDPAYIENHLSSSVLHQYPTLLGKKRVFQESRPAIVITKVTDAPEK